MTKENILLLNRLGYFQEIPFALSGPELDVKLDQEQLPWPTDLFKHPFVVDVMGASFDKPANTRYFALRFPRVQKIHHDRTFRDTVGFDELQELVRQSMEVPEESESEDRYWLQKLKRADPESDFLVKSISTVSDNLCLKESKGVNMPEYVNEWRDQEQEEGKRKTDFSPLDYSFFQPSKRKLSLENSQLPTSAIKRAKVLSTDLTDVEGMQPPSFAVTSTAVSPLQEDSSVTLSAHSSVTEHELETQVSDNQLGNKAASLTPQEGSGDPQHRMVSCNNI